MSALYTYAFIELFLLGHDELLVFDSFFFSIEQLLGCVG